MKPFGWPFRLVQVRPADKRFVVHLSREGQGPICGTRSAAGFTEIAQIGMPWRSDLCLLCRPIARKAIQELVVFV